MTSPFLVLSKLMKRSQMFMALWTVLVSSALVQPSLSAPVDARRIYTNAEYHYRLMYPAMWHISVVAGKGGPTLIQLQPLVGAGAWAIAGTGCGNLRIAAPATSAKLSTAALPENGRLRMCDDSLQNGLTTNEVGDIGNPTSLMCCGSPSTTKRQGTTRRRGMWAYYFQLNGELLKVELTYWKSDSKQASYERTHVVKSLTSIRGIGSKPK